MVTEIERFITFFTLSPGPGSDYLETAPQPAGPFSRMQRIDDDDDDEETLENLKTAKDIYMHFKSKLTPPPGYDIMSTEWLSKSNKLLKSQLALYRQMHRKTTRHLTQQLQRMQKKHGPKRTRVTRSVQTLIKNDPQKELVRTKRRNEELQRKLESVGGSLGNYKRQVDQLQKSHSALEKKVEELQAALQVQQESVVVDTLGRQMQIGEKAYSGFLQYMAEPAQNFN